MAVFTVHNVTPEETGLYHLDFTVGRQTVEIVQLDKTFYSRERARLQAEFALSREMSRPMRDAGSRRGIER